MDDRIESTIREFVAENFLFRGDLKSVSDRESLLENGLIDSMGVLELVAFLEKEFAFRVAEEDVVPENLDSISAIVAYVRQKRDVV